MTLVITGQLAAELGVSRSAVVKWHRARLIISELITPGNHLRGDAERVREQLRARPPARRMTLDVVLVRLDQPQLLTP